MKGDTPSCGSQEEVNKISRELKFWRTVRVSRDLGVPAGPVSFSASLLLNNEILTRNLMAQLWNHLSLKGVHQVCNDFS